MRLARFGHSFPALALLAATLVQEETEPVVLEMYRVRRLVGSIAFWPSLRALDAR